jgi:hypothetical protein
MSYGVLPAMIQHETMVCALQIKPWVPLGSEKEVADLTVS